MAYNVAANMQFGQPVNAFLNARDSRQRNALAERQMANQEAGQQFNQQRLMQQDQIDAQDRAQKGQQDAASRVHAMVQQLASAPPEQFGALADRFSAAPEFQQFGVTREDFTPENVQELLAYTGGMSGQAPADRFEQVDGPRGAVISKNSRTGEIKQVVGPDNTESRPVSTGAYRALTQDEISRAGLPPGTSAQVGPDGKIDVLSKRDNTGVLSQKDATTAKMKINTVALARQQLQKIKEAFEQGRKGVNAFGPGQGMLPTQAGKLFDGRVDQMRSTLTALTRVPGVGAMSDYETKLDQSKFPSRSDYETVTKDKIQNLEDMLSLIENGYKGMLTGQQEQSGPVKVSTPAEAAKLPSGTQFVTPDGQIRVKR